MSFPFSIIGTIIYALYVAIVLVAVILPLRYWLLKKLTWKWWLIAPIALSLLIAPVIEELWIEHRFDTLCEDAGVHITRKVIINGYYDGTGNGPTNIGFIKSPQTIAVYEKLGFNFIEYRVGYKLPGNKVSRVERQENGKWLLSIQSKATARYHLLQPYDHERVGHQVTKSERIIFDNKLNEVIGRGTVYSRYPGWIERLWLQYIGSGQEICRGDSQNTIESYVLYPATLNGKDEGIRPKLIENE